MAISDIKTGLEVGAVDVRFDDNDLTIVLTDGRSLHIPLARIGWLAWLANATPAHRANWIIEPGGFAVYRPDLDDGVEISHLLSKQPLT